MFKIKHQFYKNFLMMLSSNGIAQIIPFLAAPIIARAFGPEEMSIFGNILAIISLFGVVATGRFDYALVVPKHQKQAQHLFRAGIMICLLVSLLSILLFVFKAEIISFYDGVNLAPYFYLIPIGIFSQGLSALLNNWSLRFNKIKQMSLARILKSVSFNGFQVIAAYFFFGVEGLLWAWVLGNLIQIIILLPELYKNWEKRPYRIRYLYLEVIRYKDFPLINSLHAFTDIFASQVVLFWVMTSVFSPYYMGLFFMMNKYLRAPIQLVSSSISQISYRDMSQAFNNKESLQPVVRKALKISGAFALALLLGTILFSKTVFTWYLGSDYTWSGVYAQWVILPLSVNFLIAPISSIGIITNRQKQVYLWSLIGYTASIGSLYLMGKWGYDFYYSLKVYSLVLFSYFVLLFLWYFRLIKKI